MDIITSLEEERILVIWSEDYIIKLIHNSLEFHVRMRG